MAAKLVRCCVGKNIKAFVPFLCVKRGDLQDKRTFSTVESIVSRKVEVNGVNLHYEVYFFQSPVFG